MVFSISKNEQPRQNKKGKGRRFNFEGKNINTDQIVRGEVIAKNEEEAKRKLQRRGIRPLRIGRVKNLKKRRITQEDIKVFTRQLSTIMKAGLPLMQAFDTVARGHSNPAMTQMLMLIRTDVEQGNSLSAAFAKHPRHFDRFYCNLIAAGEAGGVLEHLLDKLAFYKEKSQSIRKKVRSALTYPLSIIVVAIALLMIMMIFVLPSFKEVYENMGTELPEMTQWVMAISDFFVDYGLIIVAVLIVSGVLLYQWYQRSYSFQKKMGGFLLSVPIFGSIVQKATIARWARTTATLFAAGVPLVEALDSVSGAAGNILYEEATNDIRSRVTQGLSLTSSMQGTDLFPNIVVQMTSIGEESGSLDEMLNKAAELYEDEVDNSVAQLSSLMEPIIMVVLGVIIGAILLAMYLPLFKLGSVVG